jgi:transcription initiation factor IIE alpha subunit
MEEKRDYSKYRIISSYTFDMEKARDNARKKNFKLVRKYKNYDLYEHKKYGFKECFYK